jgi:hypothetical protein
MKAMSAMTKTLVIYGIEDGRYVTKVVKKNASMNRNLIENVWSREKHPNKMFFFMPILLPRFCKQFKGHGWVGISYQIEPDEDYNEITLHPF